VAGKAWRSTFFDKENPRHDNYRQDRESRRSLLTLTAIRTGRKKHENAQKTGEDLR
jgi:hypothetical protein